MSLTFLDIFSGIGGFRLGMEMAGHKCVGHCEIDKFADKSYIAIHEPKEDEWFGTDITAVRTDEIPKSDVWCFGFPCQDISVAGKQRGLEGARSGLFYTVLELVKSQEEENKPSILFIENVKNLLSVNDGWDFANMLVSLDEAGYDAEWQVLNSKDFRVPQNRERVFIIGHFRGRDRRKVFPVGGISQKANINIVGTTVKPGAKGTNCRHWVHDVNGDVGALSATDYKQPKQIMIGYIDSNSQGNRVYDSSGLSCSLSALGGGRGAKTGLYPVSSNGKGVGVKETTKTGKGVTQALGASYNQGILVGKRIRKLTPRECFRLQGFPDWAFDRAREVNSDSQLYKQAGNSVTVNVIYEIAKRL